MENIFHNFEQLISIDVSNNNINRFKEIIKDNK